MNSENTNDLHEKGESFFDEGDYKKAVEALTLALNYEERHKSYYMRSYCYHELQEPEKALEDIDRAISIYNQNTNYFALKGVLHSMLNQSEEAIDCFSKNVELNPAIVNYQNRAIMYKKNGDYNKAIEDYTTIIEMADHKSPYYVSRSTVYRKMNLLDKVREDLNKAVEDDPDNLSTYLDTLELYITTKYYRDGYEYVSKHEEKVKDTGSGRDLLLFLYMKAVLFVCLNMKIDSFENELKELSREGYDLEWNFSHVIDWNDSSELSEDKKEKIAELSGLFE